MNPLVFLLGPTASGKTEWALRWADKASGAIVNGDSVQVYRELNIGSAKPNLKKHPHIPHYLFDQVKAPKIWTAGKYRKKALEVLHRELPKRKVFVVGGSGFLYTGLGEGDVPYSSGTRGNS